MGRVNRYVDWANRTHSVRQQVIALILAGLVVLLLLPTLLVLAATALDEALQLSRIPVGALTAALGGVTFLCGAFFALRSVAAEITIGAGTPLPVMPTQRLVVVPPFTWCRNPMTLGTILVYGSIGIWMGSLSAIALALAFGGLLLLYVRFVEEKELEARFGAEYLAYKQATPFLLPRPWRRAHAHTTPGSGATEEERHMTTLLLLSDTHWNPRSRDIPAEVWAAVDAADVVVHAGDWGEAGLLDMFQRRAKRLVACWGNVDGPALRSRLPGIARATVAGTRIAVVHDTGPAEGRERRMDALHPDTDVLVFGHSHIPWDSVTPGGMRLLNPGSPTDPRRMPHPSYMTAVVTGPGTLEVTLHELPWR